MNLFVFGGLFTWVVNLLIGFFVLIKNPNKEINRSFFWLSVCIGSWSVGSFLLNFISKKWVAFFLLKVSYVFGILLLFTFFQFIFNVTEMKMAKKWRLFLITVMLFYFSFLPGNSFIKDVRHLSDGTFMETPGFIYFLFILTFFVIGFKGLQLLFMYRQRVYGNARTQISYIFFAYTIALLSGLQYFLSVLNIVKIYPVGNFIFLLISFLILAYAIVRYRLMDIRLAVSNTAIFIAVYALVLWAPFYFYAIGFKLIALFAMLALASAGPIVFNLLRRRAEAQILKEERTILEILKKAAREIPHIKDILHLLKFITHNLQQLSVNYIAIYLWDIESNSYNLKESVPVKPNVLTVAKDNALIFELKEKRANRTVNYLNYDEIQFLTNDGNHLKLQKVISTMEGLSAQVIIPMIDDGVLLGFIVLGKREEQKLYSDELIGVLTSIGTLVGSSIADNFYWEKMGLQERRASLDHISGSMAHEIDNPMTVIGGQIQSLQLHLENPSLSMPEDLRTRMNKSMGFITEACDRVTNTIRKIQEYSKGSAGKLKPIKLSEVMESYSALMGPQFKKESFDQKIEYIKEIEPDLPYILGDKIRLEEVLVNFANNALHAVRKSDIKRINFKIYRKNGDWIRIEFSDTGYGIDKDLLKDIWLPHVTTKGSVEGTGLGLFIVRKVVEMHGGRAWAESEGTGKGATMIVELPVFKGDLKEYLEEEPQKGVKKAF